MKIKKNLIVIPLLFAFMCTGCGMNNDYISSINDKEKLFNYNINEITEYDIGVVAAKVDYNTNIASKLNDIFKEYYSDISYEESSFTCVLNHNILLSENEELMKKLDDLGYGNFIRREDNYLSKISSKKWEDMAGIMLAYGGYLGYNGNSIWYFSDDELYIDKNTKDIDYIVNGFSDDGWTLISSSYNDKCDSVVYLIEKNHCENHISGELDKLYVFGKDDDIKEVKYTSNSNDTPELGKKTMLNYFMKIGLTQTEANEIINNPPTENTTLHGIKIIVENHKDCDEKYVLKISK